MMPAVCVTTLKLCCSNVFCFFNRYTGISALFDSNGIDIEQERLGNDMQQSAQVEIKPMPEAIIQDAHPIP